MEAYETPDVVASFDAAALLGEAEATLPRGSCYTPPR